MKTLALLICLSFLSCRNQTLELKDIENEVNEAITERLMLNEESLLEAIIQLYQKDVAIKKLKNNSDFENIKSIIEEVEVRGTFDIIDTSLQIEAQELRKKLDRINFYDSLDLNFKFLHITMEPIINKYEDFYNTFEKDDLNNNLIYNIGITNLDTINISFTLYLIGLKNNIEKEHISKKTNLNIVLLTTYGNFIYFATE